MRCAACASSARTSMRASWAAHSARTPRWLKPVSAEFRLGLKPQRLRTVPMKRLHRRGRPPKDDQMVVDMAAALMAACGLGPQRARDLALSYAEGRVAAPTKLPRGSRKAAPGSLAVGYELPLATFEGRDATITQKLRRGDVR